MHAFSLCFSNGKSESKEVGLGLKQQAVLQEKDDVFIYASVNLCPSNVLSFEILLEIKTHIKG